MSDCAISHCQSLPRLTNIARMCLNSRVMQFAPSWINAQLAFKPSSSETVSPGKKGSEFAGLISEDKSWQQDIEGMSGEASWLMAQDKFSKMVHFDVRILKALPMKFIAEDNFLSICAPAEATQKCVMLNQGRELCGLPQTILKVFKKHNHSVLPTAPDASNQNPVKQHTKLFPMLCKLC